MKRIGILLALSCVLFNIQAAEYLISQQTVNTGEIINHKDVDYTVGGNAFSDFASTDIVIPLTGVYSGQLTDIEKNIAYDDISFKVCDKALIVENANVGNISIYSVTGVLMVSVENPKTIDLSNLKGVYIAVVTDIDGRQSSRKDIL